MQKFLHAPVQINLIDMTSKSDAIEQVARAICTAYGDDFDEQPADLETLKQQRARERGDDGAVQPFDPGLPTQEDWLRMARAAVSAYQTTLAAAGMEIRLRKGSIKYLSGKDVLIGDRVRLWKGKLGRVVASLDLKEFSTECSAKEWGHLKFGVLIKADSGDIFHYEETDEDFELVRRKRQANLHFKNQRS